ncbi:hypothetical protein PTTG_25706 [Puccinia triticina 1-1 BBBD Race 1]|uniref:Bromo domain-containing protein n=1 Tax=Puccinia triticina (isolate 1-1 / race 1 (BBBD)) TaxID=630390 RepID=A0A180H136_PUCT1|nr:hypothetical protein PTTG_25706 [Puccinia triticina 1-1 BBBD Race 1]WAR57294.1 hypothetical protein PtB15_8B341 [Puccinia triticina]
MTDTISHPTRIRIISSANNTSTTNQNSSNPLKRKQPQQPAEPTPQTLPGSSKKLTLRLRPPPPQQQQLPPSASASSSPNPISSIAAPTPDQINQIRSHGLQLWYRIVNSTDPDGRLRSIAFMDLPSAADYPDYYQFIKHPIALNLIKSKLDSERDPYLSLDKLLADLKLVFSNAKKYNVEQSGIYKDAQALLKIVRKDPFPAAKGANHQNQPETAEPKQKKLRIKLRPSQPTQQIPPSATHTNGTQPLAPDTVVIPPTPVDGVYQNGIHPAAPPAPGETRVQICPQTQHPVPTRPQLPATGQLPSISPQEIERIQSEVRAETEARSRAQQDAQQRELRAREESRQQEEAQLRQQAQTRQIELRQQAEAQQAHPRTQAPSLTRVESQAQAQPTSSQTEPPLLAQIPIIPKPRSPARLQAQSQLQSPSRRAQTPTIGQSLLPEPTTPNTRASQVRTSPRAINRPTTPTPSHQPPRSPSPSKPKVNLNKLRLWIKTVLENLEGLTDRAGRQLVEEFRTLPDKARWKTYYQIIPQPIAMDNINMRNNRTGYKDFQSFRDDVFRMFKNAQHFNEDGSMVWNDSKVLETKFVELIHHPPQELAPIVLPHLPDPNAKKDAPPSPSGSLNGKRKSPGKEMPARLVGPSATLAAPIAIAGLRRSSRSPSRPPSALGSPPVTRSSRAVSPLPRRAPSPLGQSRKPAPLHPAHAGLHAPPSRPPSRLAADISPALISISNGARPADAGAGKPGPKPRSMPVIPLKALDGHPPMISRFRITSRPKTMETLKIKNRRVFQHAFRVPRGTESVVVESELNRAWPLTRQLRSSVGLVKVKVDHVRVRGMPAGPGLLQAGGAGGSSANGAGQPEKDAGVLLTEVKLVDGLNLVELAVTGNPDAHKLDPAVLALPPSSAAPSAVGIPGGPANGSAPASVGLVRESYRLFIYR